MSKRIIHLILVSFLSIGAKGNNVLEFVQPDSVELNLCYIKNDSLRSVLNHFFLRTGGTYEQYYEVQVCERNNILIMMFTHLRDENCIIDEIQIDSSTMVLYGCLQYNNLSFFIKYEKGTNIEKYFETLNNRILLSRVEREDRRSDGIFFVYLQTEFYLFDGKQVKKISVKELRQLWKE